MNKRFIEVLAISGLILFLAGNILYDILDTPEHPANSMIFYLPFCIMNTTVIFFCYENRAKDNALISAIWFCFLWLSIGQFIKFFGFNPFVQMVSDYIYLGIVIAGSVWKYKTLKTKLNAGRKS